MWWQVTLIDGLDSLWNIWRNVDVALIKLSLIPTLYTTALTIRGRYDTWPRDLWSRSSLQYLYNKWVELNRQSSSIQDWLTLRHPHYKTVLCGGQLYLYILYFPGRLLLRDYSSSKKYSSHSWWGQISEKTRSASHYALHHFYLCQHILRGWYCRLRQARHLGTSLVRHHWLLGGVEFGLVKPGNVEDEVRAKFEKLCGGGSHRGWSTVPP